MYTTRSFSLASLVGVMLLLLTADVLSAQSLRGLVRDSRTGRPVAEAVVQIVSTRQGALTDSAGRFEFAMAPAGAQMLRVRRLGYDTLTQSVTIAESGPTNVELSMTEAAAVVAPVVVSATRERQRRTENSATVDVLDGGALRLARASHPAQVMKRISGVYVSQLSGEGHSMAIRQPITTKPMYLYLEDGVPTRATGFFNHNALYEVNLPQSGGIEVLKGPGTALYGSDAIGGVVNALSRPAPLGVQAEGLVEGGAYGWQRALLSAGTTRGRNGIRADLNLTKMEGWRSDAPYDRQSGTIRWDYRAGDNTNVRTVVTASQIDQRDVLAQDTAQFRARSPLNRSPIAFRHVEAARWSTAVEHESGSQSWSVTPYARRNVLNLLPSWQLTFDPQVWQTSNTSVGMLTRYRRDFAPMRTRAIVGLDMDLSPGSFIADQAVLTATGTGANRVFSAYNIGARHYDYDATFHSVSPYVHVEASPIQRLRFDVGLRADMVGYDYTTNLAPMDTGAHRIPPSQSQNYRRISPKIGATFDVARGLNLFGSYRTGFRAPSHSNLYQQNTALNSTSLQPVTVESREVGVRGENAARFAWSLSAYDMTINNDIITFVTAQNTREATNAGRTSHRGVEGSLGARVLRTVRLDLSGAFAEHKYVEWRPQAARTNVSAIVYDGNRMEQAPRTLANALVTWNPSLLRGGRLALEWSHTGGYETDPANVGPRYAGHELFTLHANAHVHRGVEVFGRVVNITDRNYAELVGYDRFQGVQYTPGNPRSVFVGVRLSAER